MTAAIGPIDQHGRANVDDVEEEKLSDARNHGEDDDVLLAGPRLLTIETARAWIDDGEARLRRARAARGRAVGRRRTA